MIVGLSLTLTHVGHRPLESVNPMAGGDQSAHFGRVAAALLLLLFEVLDGVEELEVRWGAHFAKVDVCDRGRATAW